MLPFIVALIFAVGLPLMPSSLHRALHLPTLKFNFLSARQEPEQLFVSSPEPTLLLESSYSEASPDSGGFQYLVFPDISSQDYRDDTAAAPAGMSLMEKQEYFQSSIWNTIHAQLLYQLAEATIIITLSFFAAAAFFPRHYLYTLLERLCTALFIYRQYSPKAALSSFLQDVFSGLHRYWMENSVVKGQAPKSDADTSWLATLEVFADIAPGGYCERGASVSSVSVSVRQDHLNNILPLDKANLCFGRSSFIASSISLVQSAKLSPPTNAACTPLLGVSSYGEIDISEQERLEPQCILGTDIKRDPSHTTPPTVITEAMKFDLDTSDAETFSHSAISPLHLLETPEPSINTSLPASSHLHSSTGSLPSISMEDLYNSARRGIATALPSEPSRGIQEAIVSDPSANSCSSCGHEPLRNIAGTTSNPEFEKFQSESDSTSSLRIFQGSRRRYRSDGVQVRAESCYLGDTAAPLAPAKVDATCAFWKCALQNGGGNVEMVVKEASEGTLPGSRAAPHIGGDNPEPADGSPIVTDAALTGIVITPEGLLVVPASQRQDGSLRKEIRVRPGHTLREPLAEKYRPPAARRRTSTWDPRMHECTESPSASPHPHDFLLSFTPKGLRQPLFVRHNNSPAALSDNWRRSSFSPTVEGTPPIAALAQPSMEVKLSPAVVEAHERNLPSKTSPSLISTSPMIMTATRAIAPVSNLVSFPIQSAYRLSSHSVAHGSSPTKNATGAIKETTQASNSVSRDSCVDRQPEEPSPTPCTSTDATGAGRRPLKDITGSMVPRPKAIDFQAHTLPITANGSTLAILKQATHSKEAFKMPDGVARATVPPNSPRKRKPSVEPNVPCAAEVLQLNDTPIPHHLPRARRSAPHLGKYTHNNKMQQVKAPRAAQTPDGSKRRRTRTSSARGVENWDFNWATPTIDSNGQIVLPAGLGWKGRSSAGTGAGAMAGQPQPQRQGQPTQAIV